MQCVAQECLYCPSTWWSTAELPHARRSATQHSFVVGNVDLSNLEPNPRFLSLSAELLGRFVLLLPSADNNCGMGASMGGDDLRLAILEQRDHVFSNPEIVVIGMRCSAHPSGIMVCTPPKPSRPLEYISITRVAFRHWVSVLASDYMINQNGGLGCGLHLADWALSTSGFGSTKCLLS